MPRVKGILANIRPCRVSKAEGTLLEGGRQTSGYRRIMEWTGPSTSEMWRYRRLPMGFIAIQVQSNFHNNCCSCLQIYIELVSLLSVTFVMKQRNLHNHLLFMFEDLYRVN